MNSTSTPLSPIFLVVRSLGLAAILLLAGCANNNGIFADGNAGSPKWFNSAEPDTEESVVISRDPKLLANGSEVEVAIHNAVELSRQKRFIEARHLLAEVRELQKPKSDGHRSVTCAMALLALREGDIGNFRRLARQLDTSLGIKAKLNGLTGNDLAPRGLLFTRKQSQKSGLAHSVLSDDTYPLLTLEGVVKTIHDFQISIGFT